MKYYMFNKPAGCVTAKKDALHKTVMDYFPADEREELHPVGRLDKDTEGLLLVTSDGMLTHRIMQPKGHIPKTYFFYAAGTLTDDKIEAVKNGLMLTGQTKPTLPAEIRCISTGVITEITDYLPPSKKEKLLKNPAQKIFSGEITITEGRNHQVKRMLREINCCILYLKRIKIGDIELDPNLEYGKYRLLSSEELSSLGI